MVIIRWIFVLCGVILTGCGMEYKPVPPLVALEACNEKLEHYCDQFYTEYLPNVTAGGVLPAELSGQDIHEKIELKYLYTQTRRERSGEELYPPLIELTNGLIGINQQPAGDTWSRLGT